MDHGGIRRDDAARPCHQSAEVLERGASRCRARAGDRRPLGEDRAAGPGGKPLQQGLMHLGRHVPQRDGGLGAYQNIARRERQGGQRRGARCQPGIALQRRRHVLRPEPEARQKEVDHRQAREEGVEGEILDVDQPPRTGRRGHRQDLGQVGRQSIELRHQRLGGWLDPGEHHIARDGAEGPGRVERLQTDDAVAQADPETVHDRRQAQFLHSVPAFHDDQPHQHNWSSLGYACSTASDVPLSLQRNHHRAEGRGISNEAPMAGNTKDVTDASFDTDVLKATGPVVVDFWAEWCGPCRAISPALEEISAEYEGKLTIAKVNIDENPETPNNYAVRGIPTLILFKDGKPAATQVGAAPKSVLKAWIERSL